MKLALSLALLGSLGQAVGEVRLRGQVASETGVPVGGAVVSLRLNEKPASVFSVQTDPSGAFRLVLPHPGEYLATVAREGFFRLESRPVQITESTALLQFVLNPVREVFESIEVPGEPAMVDPDRIVAEQTLDNSDMIQAPYPGTSNLRNALRLMPGMVRDPKGGLHLHGAAEEQTLYALDGFNISDPLTGRFESRLTVESVQAVDTTAAVVPAEFGKGSGGLMAISSKTGDDKLRYEATNFLPALEHRKGWIIGGWSPRFGVSGPIRRGRAWFSNNLFLQYDKTVIDDLPEGEDRVSSWRVSNLSHVQINLTPSNIFTVGFLLNAYSAPQSGLSALDPPETTVDRRQRQWFLKFKDQMFFSRGAALELGYAWNRTFGREIPQGPGIFQITPYGKQGNYFIDATRYSGRDQVIVNYIFPLLARNQLKAGLDLDRISYRQAVFRTGYEYFRSDFTPARKVLFYGEGGVSRGNYEASAYVLDSWRPRENLMVTFGLRSDWDRLVNNHSFAPRAAFTWNPGWGDGLRVSGGWAIARDATNVRLFARALDQDAAAVYFDFNGSALGDPRFSIYVQERNRFRAPRYQNWSLGLDRRFGQSFFGRLGYLRKRGARGLAFQNSVDPADTPPRFDAIYDLGNHRYDSYDGVEFTVRQLFRKQYEWMASYIWSRSRTTAALDVSVDDPVLVYENTGPTSWDVPHRLLSWGYLPAPWKFKNWAVAYMTEWHSGVPFYAQNDRGGLVGGANSLRFPTFFELNLHLEWRFVLRGHRWAIRGGCNNLTSHRNYITVNNVVSSPEFMSFYGAQNRTFNFRIRWLGKL
jgi:hypothetical protein